MKGLKKLTTILIVIAVIVGTSVTPIFAEFDFNDPGHRAVADSHDVRPGDALRAGYPPGVILSWGYDHDLAELFMVEPDYLPKLKIREAIIVGDSLEFTEAAITYEDGTVIYGKREIFSDGEYISLIPDKSIQGMRAEVYIGFKSVKGTSNSDLYEFDDGQCVGIGEGYYDGAESPYSATAQITHEGSVLDLMAREPKLIRSYDLLSDTMNFATAVYYGGEPGTPVRNAQQQTVLPTTATPITFSDVPENHWAKEYIRSAAAKGLIKGIGDNQFNPDGTLTKAQIAQMLYNAYGDPVNGAIGLRDIKSSDWYYEAILWSLSNNLNMIESIDYGPNDPAPRWYVAYALWKLAAAKEVELPEVNLPAQFIDLDEISKDRFQSGAIPAISALQRAGIINGKPGDRFDPSGAITRAEAAKIIDLFTQINGLEPKQTSP